MGWFGMSRTEPGPEHSAKHEFTEWLESHGATVWWEESNAWDYDLFTIDRGGEAPATMPDLLVEIDDYALVVEFKPGESKSEVYDALLQLQGYWLNHVVHDQTYIAGDRSVRVDGFLTATKHSRFGRLFAPYAEGERQDPDDMDEGRASCHKYGQLPPSEFPMTEQHIRTLWRLGKRAEQNVGGADRVPYLGSLLSEHLEVETVDPRPAVLWNKGRANQTWEVLGE